MRNIRFSIACFLSLAIFLSMHGSLRPTRADTGGRFLLPYLASSDSIDVNDGSNLDWPANALSFTITPVLGPGMEPGGTGKMIIKRPDDPMQDDELYVTFTVTDTTPNLVDQDNVVLMFDLGHDHAAAITTSFVTSNDRGIRFRRIDAGDMTTQAVHRVFGAINNPMEDDTMGAVAFPALPVASMMISRAKITNMVGGSWLVEAKLFPSDLGVSNFNALMGVAVRANDLNTMSAVPGVWPSTSGTNPNSWGNLITRKPIDYALLIDQSGSMTGVKWDSARRAGDNFAVILSKMKDPTLDNEFGPAGLNLSGGGDRLGLASFTWNVDSNDTTIKAALGPIPASPPMGGYSTTNLPMTPGGWTPIAWGINRTVQMFTGVVPDATNPSLSSAATTTALNATPRTRVVMLLSDGQHNRPNSSINYAVGGSDFSYVPAGCNVMDPMNTNSLVRVNTIGVGNEATVDPDTLIKIKKCFSGSAFTQEGSDALNIYNITGSVVGTEAQLTAQLTRFFVTTLTPYFHWNFIHDGAPPPTPFTLKAGERKVLIFAFWANKGDANQISITKPDMSTATDMGDTNLGVATIVLNNPAAGDYTNFTAMTTAPSHVMVLIDLRTEAQFAIDNRPHGTGSRITLKGKLRDDGRPVTGADVQVDIRRPTEAFGTYASTHLPSNCSAVHPPQLPSPRTSLELTQRLDRITGAGPQGGGFVVAPGGVLVSTGTGSPDTLAPHFALIQQLFQACGKTQLNNTENLGLKLFDDATHGDATANDGIYTLSFENTTLEGSYIFRFRAQGTTPDGTSFKRVREVGEHLRIDVDPDSSGINFRDLQQSGTIVTREYHVTPRDRFAGYLGPGKGDSVSFNTTAGTFITPLIDYNNGIYSQVLRFDRATENPVVTGTVQGKPLKPAGGFGAQGFEFFPYIGGSFYENSLGLKNGFTTGARFGYRFPNQLALEFESGVTFSRFNTGPFTGQRAYLVQVLGNVRYDIDQWGTVNWTPYVIAGAGGVFLNGGAGNDSAFAVHSGFGSTWRLTNHIGLRADGRVFRFGALNGAGSTTSFQFNGGVVFKF